MKLAMIGSRGLRVDNLQDYIPVNVTEIVSGGAVGVDASARKFAIASGIKFTEFLPEYRLYGRRAPLIRNLQIIRSVDQVLAFWDGTSRGTKYVINACRKEGVPITIYLSRQAAQKFYR